MAGFHITHVCNLWILRLTFSPGFDNLILSLPANEK